VNKGRELTNSGFSPASDIDYESDSEHAEATGDDVGDITGRARGAESRYATFWIDANRCMRRICRKTSEVLRRRSL
jgi:hypothetical protein